MTCFLCAKSTCLGECEAQIKDLPADEKACQSVRKLAEKLADRMCSDTSGCFGEEDARVIRTLLTMLAHANNETAQAKSAAWNNFLALQEIDGWLIEHDLLTVNYHGGGVEAGRNVVDSLEAIRINAARWSKARQYLSIEDIEQWRDEMKGHQPTEEENLKADAEIDKMIPAQVTPSLVVTERDTKSMATWQEEFERWWENHGQFVRSGGGQYEKTFAFASWRHLFGEGVSAPETQVVYAHAEDGHMFVKRFDIENALDGAENGDVQTTSRVLKDLLDHTKKD